MVWLLDGRNKEIATAATTYKALQNVVDEIAACSYPESKLAEVEEEVVPSAEPIVSIVSFDLYVLYTRMHLIFMYIRQSLIHSYKSTVIYTVQ